MSRWFPERIALHVAAADSLAGVVAGVATGVAAGSSLRERMREGALAAFEAQLGAIQAPRRSRVACVFAGDLVRYCIVPWNPGALAAVRREVFARHCFQEIHGDAAAAWSVRVDEPPYGHAALACAVETALIDGVAARLKDRGFVLERVQPSLMHAAHAARRALRTGSFWLVAQEPRTTTLWLVVERQPLLVKVLAAREHDLGLVLAREWLALGLEPARCPVIVISPDFVHAPRLAGWNVRVLGGSSAKAATDAASAIRSTEPAGHALGSA